MTEAVEKKPRVPLGAGYWKLWSASVVSNVGDGVASIAYPWLASAATRNAMLIALIAVAQRLPWLLFTLPAGVITDRVDRRKIMVWMNAFRTVLTTVIAVVVVWQTGMLPNPTMVTGGADPSTNWIVYVTLLIGSLLFGMAEVLYDNSAQTILPAMVVPEGLERANGNLWSAEMVANSFAGPPLGSLLIGIAFALPFFFDAGSFALSAALLFFIAGSFRAKRDQSELDAEVDWWSEIKAGVRWLWRNPLLRVMAIVLGLLNATSSMVFATFVLFAQEVLEVNAFLFAILSASAALGGALGGVLGPRLSARIGSGGALTVTFVVSIVMSVVIGFTSSWVVVFVGFAAIAFAAVLWNVVTVSFRQTIIPDDLLGRVNSVYRFFGWGMMPIGLLLGGLLVSLTEAAGGSRDLALRVPWFVAGAALLVLFAYAGPKLTTEAIESARAAGIGAKEAADPTADEEA
jgi:MFS family permease